MSSALLLPGTGPGGYIRPTWREAVLEYVPQRWRGLAGDRWVDGLPVLVVLAVLTAMALRLHNTAFAAEAHAIDVGRDYLSYWFGSGVSADHTRDFTGLPVLYPVL